MDWELPGRLLFLFFLAAGAWMDGKEKRISVYYVAVGFAAGILFRTLVRQMPAVEVAGGCLTGGALFLLAFLSRQQIGYGDGLMLAATGAFLGLFNNLLLFTVSLFLAGAVAGILLITGRKKRKSRLPFLPFMLAGYVFLLAVI